MKCVASVRTNLNRQAKTADTAVVSPFHPGRDIKNVLRLVAIAVLTFAAWFLASAAFSQSDGTTSQVIERGYVDARTRDFVLGNLEFLLIHELAHVLISEKEIPIIGPIESAADYLATIALIRTDPFDPAHDDQPLDFLLAAADAFSAAWDLGSSIGAEIPYWGNHALGIQRYYQIACLLYGSDPVRFARLIELADLPEGRARNCVTEFEQANSSTQWLIDTFGRRPGDPAVESPAIVYEEPRTRIAAELLRAVQSSGLIDQTLDRFGNLFYLEQPLVTAIRNCGGSEAAWLPEQRELVVCYELLNTIYLLSMKTPTEGLGRALQ